MNHERKQESEEPAEEDNADREACDRGDACCDGVERGLLVAGRQGVEAIDSTYHRNALPRRPVAETAPGVLERGAKPHHLPGRHNFNSTHFIARARVGVRYKPNPDATGAPKVSFLWWIVETSKGESNGHRAYGTQA